MIQPARRGLLNLGGERLADNLVPRTLIRNVKALHAYSEVRFPILNKIGLLYWSHLSTHYSGVTLPENCGETESQESSL